MPDRICDLLQYLIGTHYFYNKFVILLSYPLHLKALWSLVIENALNFI